MLLTEFNYSRDMPNTNEWILEDLNLGRLNLIVGKNATGKTITLQKIIELARLLSGKTEDLINGHWKVKFKNDNFTYEYNLHIENGLIKEEKLIGKNKKILIVREDKRKEILSVSKNEREKFDPPKDKLTIQVRRDKTEYPFLEDLYEWGTNLPSFTFSGIRFEQLIEKNLGLFFKNLLFASFLLETIFEKYPQYKDNIIEDTINDLEQIGYELKDIDLTYRPYLDKEIPIIVVQEEDLKIPLSQFSLSAGMNRAIAIIIIFNYYKLFNTPVTIIIDDLGEGLDFDRASKLTKLLFEKAKECENMQLIVSSNSRFLLNAVDLEYWNVLDRDKQHIKTYNYIKNKEIFEEFAFTGLSNFDFFSYDFYKETISND